MTKEEHEAALATATTAALANGEKAGGEAMQARISGILNCEAATGRTKFANHLAFKTGMSVDDAAEMLNASAAESAAVAAPVAAVAPADSFNAAMTTHTAEPIGADATPVAKTDVEFAMASFNAANGDQA